MSVTPRNKSMNDMFNIAFFISIIVCLLAGWFLWLDKGSEFVIESTDAGAAISAGYSNSAFGAYVTNIETTNGVFKVQGTLAINKGDRFTLEERENGDKKLCKANTKDCRTLTE